MKTIKFLTALSLAILMISCDSDDDNSSPPSSIDLETSEISFSIANRNDFTADTTITGTLTNIGDDFSSGTGQQIILLFERARGAPANSPGEEVGRLNFTNLAAGQTLTVSYTRFWDASSPAEGEFPPDYIFEILYDPDLLLDSNEDNDDDNRSNDQIERNGQGINELFN